MTTPERKDDLRFVRRLDSRLLPPVRACANSIDRPCFIGMGVSAASPARRSIA